MTTKILPEKKLPANPPGWKGNIYFTSGKVETGPAFGIALRPGKFYDFDVYFPIVSEKPKPVIIHTQPIPTFSQSVTNVQMVHSSPQQNVTDNLCIVCGNRIEGKRIDRHYCSARCRKRASRQGKQLKLAGVR